MIYRLKNICISLASLLLFQSAFSMDRITIVQGNIVQQDVDCIVNAANVQLAGGAGVCGAIFAAAGDAQLQAACNQFPLQVHGIRCATGHAKITRAFQLEGRGIRFIIHAVGPRAVDYPDAEQQSALIRSVIRESLTLASQQNVRSIAFPSISTGIYGCDINVVARAAINAAREYLQLNNNTSIQEVRFVLFDARSTYTYRHIYNEMLGFGPQEPAAAQRAVGQAAPNPLLPAHMPAGLAAGANRAPQPQVAANQGRQPQPAAHQAPVQNANQARTSFSVHPLTVALVVGGCGTLLYLYMQHNRKHEQKKEQKNPAH